MQFFGHNQFYFWRHVILLFLFLVQKKLLVTVYMRERLKQSVQCVYHSMCV